MQGLAYIFSNRLDPLWTFLKLQLLMSWVNLDPKWSYLAVEFLWNSSAKRMVGYVYCSLIPLVVFIPPRKCYGYGSFKTLVRSTTNHVKMIVRGHAVYLLLRSNKTSKGNFSRSSSQVTIDQRSRS